MIANYFDYAAATPLDDEVFKAMQPYLSEKFFNPSAGYLASKNVAKELNSARSDIAGCIGVKPSEIIFTAGGTEANNLAINGIMQQFPDAEILVSSIEHDSVLLPAKSYDYKEIPVSPSGYVKLEKLEKLISNKTVLLSVMLANNEIGTIQPIKKISNIVASVNSQRKKSGNNLPLVLHTDASQAGNYILLNANRLGVDMMTVNGGKIYGPKQTAFLYVNSKIALLPQIIGGGQERNVRSGTENMAGFIGLSKAFSNAQRNHAKEAEKVGKLRELFVNEFSNSTNLVINGGDVRLPNNVHITLKGHDNETLMMQLDEAGFQVAVGSACSASNDEPSHVLKAIGLSDEEAQSSLRITFGKHSTEKSVKALAKTLKSLL